MRKSEVRQVDLKSVERMVSDTSLEEIKQQVDKLTPAEKNELLQYLDQRLIKNRDRKIAAAGEAMARMDVGRGVSSEKIWSVAEEPDGRK
jgi:hypothetical protein